jgi:hypothetical protein
MRSFFVLSFIIALYTSVFGQNDSIDPVLLKYAPKPVKAYTVPDPKPYGDLITPADMSRLINEIASDEMMGRETGTEGQLKAADYIAQKFEADGMLKVGDRNSYFQYFQLVNERWQNLQIEANQSTWKNIRDYYIVPSEFPDSFAIEAKEIVYAGYGVDTDSYTDYKKSKVKGKIVMVEFGEPMNDAGVNLLTGKSFRTEWSYSPLAKAVAAAKMGAKMLIYIDPKFDERTKADRKTLAGYGWNAKTSAKKSVIPILYISRKMADQLLSGSTADVKAKSDKAMTGASTKTVALKTAFSLKAKKEVRNLNGSNVVGYLEGTDSLLKKEVVVITAHYDHLGVHDSLLYNGADDNASGTAGVIEIANAFAQAAKAGIKPKRSVLFMLVSGEEKGLLGSEFYTNFPIFPLKNTVCNINTDMIGRVDDAHKNNPNYIYVIGSDRLSTELHKINEEMNATYTKLQLDYQYNALDDPNHYYERSDHYNFAKNGIPAIFYFNGTHADYHKATDTKEKITPEPAALRTQLAFYTAWEIAFRPMRITVDKK